MASFRTTVGAHASLGERRLEQAGASIHASLADLPSLASPISIVTQTIRCRTWRSDATLRAVQAAFIDHDGFQCGFCTAGQITRATEPCNQPVMSPFARSVVRPQSAVARNRLARGHCFHHRSAPASEP